MLFFTGNLRVTHQWRAAFWSPLLFTVSLVAAELIGELQGSRQPNKQKLEKYVSNALMKWTDSYVKDFKVYVRSNQRRFWWFFVFYRATDIQSKVGWGLLIRLGYVRLKDGSSISDTLTSQNTLFLVRAFANTLGKRIIWVRVSQVDRCTHLPKTTKQQRIFKI